MNIIHKSNCLNKEQKSLIQHIEEVVRVNKSFDDTVKSINNLIRGHNNDIKDQTPIGQIPKFEFILSVFKEDREIYVADNPIGNDFYIISL